MRELLYQLGRGFAFSRIAHPDLTGFQRWVPIGIAVLLTGGYVALPDKPPLVGEGGLSRHLISVFSTLPGFFIAALAAVATFSRPEMDMVMPAPAPRLRLKLANQRDWVDLTFRMFLSHLFAYLTTLAFTSVFVFVGADLLSASGSVTTGKLVGTELYPTVSLVVNVIYVGLALWLTTKVVLTTLFGLYFLAERVHRPNA
jgi:hypothetical protein